MRKCDKCGGKGYILVDDFISLPNMLKPVICPSCSDNIEEVKQTNADKIRSMSNDELMKYLSNALACSGCERITGKCGLKEGIGCDSHLLKWLQSEVSNGD